MPSADFPLPAIVAAAKASLERAGRLRRTQAIHEAFAQIRNARTKALRKEVRERRKRDRISKEASK